MKTLTAALLCLLPLATHAATYDSGSDGSDGALVFAPYLGHVVFNPDDFDPALDADRDGVYHFTSITIGRDTYVRLGANMLGHRPVIWLSQGDIVIDGGLDLYGGSQYNSYGYYTDPGAGGFPGGAPGMLGAGPGASQDLDKPSAVHSIEYPNSTAKAYGNAFLVPALGGSGEAGNSNGRSIYQGGGAIILASNTKIFLDDGGIASTSDGGSGGAIRIIAPYIESDSGGIYVGDDLDRLGRIRLEYFTLTGRLWYSDAPGVTFHSTPGPAVIEPPIKIVSVDENPIPQKPGASGPEPDYTITTPGEVTVTVEAKGIPLGTPVKISVYNEALGNFYYMTDALSGTLAQSTASATFEVPPGKNIFLASADWRDE